MAMASARQFGGSSYPVSPSPTASSVNYSQYDSNSFASRSRGPSVSSSTYSGRNLPIRNGSAGGSLKPPGMGGGGGGGGAGGGKLDSREVARVHWNALRGFLREWLEKESPTARASAREKLTRLTKLQFQELSTDVYDELLRRLDADRGPSNAILPFLPVRDDFHPKRNQARQKLATLPKNRFKDLASDVFHELRRRYPEFEEQETEETVYDDEPPPAPGPISSRSPYSQTSSHRDRDRQRENPTPPSVPRLNSHQRQGSRNISNSSSVSSSGVQRSRPSREGTRDFLDQQNVFSNQPNLNASTNDIVVPNKSRMREEDVKVPFTRDPPTRDAPNGNLNAATNDVVVPNKSRMKEEDVKVPYSRNTADNNNPNAVSTTNDVVVPLKSRMREEEIEVPYARDSGLTDDRPLSGESVHRDSRGSSIHDAKTPRQDLPPNDVLSPQTADDRNYFDRMSFSSNVTSKSRAPPVASGWDDEREQKIRSDYEFRIAALERRANVAETERDDAKKRETEEKERRKEWEDEVRGLKERAALHASSLRSMQSEIDAARDAADIVKKQAEQSAKEVDDQVAQWRERCEGLEEELRRSEVERSALEAAESFGAGNTGEAVAELKNEIHSLVAELNSLSATNDSLMMHREQDAHAVQQSETRVAEYKRKYDAVRIELRNLKATSTMFVSKPLSDDHLPASADGNIADINVSAFQTAIDGMLTAARSTTPSGVLPAMKTIVEAVTEIGEDVKAFEARPNLDVDVSHLESLKHESTARLNNLMQAARNHAKASGLSPVSLIDAAAGHLTANVVEIIKLLKIRRNGQQLDLRPSRSSLSIKDMVDRSRNGTPTEPKSATSGGFNFAGIEDRVRDPMGMRKQSSDLVVRERIVSPTESRTIGNNGINGINGSNSVLNNLRVNSYQSASSIARSDSFDLERKASVTSDHPQQAQQPQLPPRTYGIGAGAGGEPERRVATPRQVNGYGRSSETSATTSGSSAVAPATAEAEQDSFRYGKTMEDDLMFDKGGDDHEWEDVKPYLETQSSALVNSIQNLLAAIRTGSQSPALNEHLSEVIAIASSIVAVSTNALPLSLRPEGSPLLKDLVANTNRLSEAQEQAKGGQFDKAVRQVIASASFGVAKSLKALMKLGTE